MTQFPCTQAGLQFDGDAAVDAVERAELDVVVVVVVVVAVIVVVAVVVAVVVVVAPGGTDSLQIEQKIEK